MYIKVRDSKEGMIEINSDDAMISIVEFENDASGAFESSGVATGRQNQMKEICGFTNVNVTQVEHPFMDVWWPKGHNIGWEQAYINEIAHFVDCVANNREVAPLGATFLDGYKAAVIIDTIKESSLIGKKIYVQY